MCSVGGPQPHPTGTSSCSARSSSAIESLGATVNSGLCSRRWAARIVGAMTTTPADPPSVVQRCSRLAARLVMLAFLIAGGAIATTDTVAAATTERWSGEDRYATSVGVSEEAFPSGADTVFIATGESFPDALAAGPVAASLDGPILLTATNQLTCSGQRRVAATGPEHRLPAWRSRRDLRCCRDTSERSNHCGRQPRRRGRPLRHRSSRRRGGLPVC